MRLRNLLPWLLLAIVLAAGWRHWQSPAALPVPSVTQPRQPAPETPTAEARRAAPAASAETAQLPTFLPPEARATIALIQRDGPFPHRQDGSVFGNREGLLPRQPRGWYREYTVDTPGLGHRGARRIVTGGTPPREWYYSDDHYRSFRRFDVPGSQP